MQSTRYLIQNTVNLPVSGIGRVIDAFNKMAESVAEVDGLTEELGAYREHGSCC